MLGSLATLFLEIHEKIKTLLGSTPHFVTVWNVTAKSTYCSEG